MAGNRLEGRRDHEEANVYTASSGPSSTPQGMTAAGVFNATRQTEKTYDTVPDTETKGGLGSA